MASITVDTRDFGKLHDELEKFRKTALPYAQRNALNGCAFELQKSWRAEVKRTFTNRNQFTERSVLVDKAQGLDTKAMKATTGSTAPFMGDQEEGGTVHGRGAHKAIPAPVAGGGAGAGVRPRLVAGRYKLSAIQLQRTGLTGYGRRQANAIAISMAARRGERFALLNRGGSKGRAIFEVKGSRGHFRTKLIWNVSKGSVHVKPEPTMHHAVQRSYSAFGRITQQALLDQLKRNKVMGY